MRRSCACHGGGHELGGSNVNHDTVKVGFELVLSEGIPASGVVYGKW
jgi:hypothetical protein